MPKDVAFTTIEAPFNASSAATNHTSTLLPKFSSNILALALYG